MSIAVTERTASTPTAIEFTVKLATGLLVVTAAFLILLAINAAVVPPEIALQMFQQ